MESNLFQNMFEVQKNEELDFSVNLIAYSICTEYDGKEE